MVQLGSGGIRKIVRCGHISERECTKVDTVSRRSVSPYMQSFSVGD